MTSAITAAKNDPADFVRLAYDGLEAGAHEVLGDELSATVKRRLADPIETMYPQLVAG
ncbi:MAG TPA: hypothetical protein VGC18_13855 [Lacisediminihabitans sp.]|uniref:hypothetical protein n=1 Tax=Lacisediminihabitans sp. TaxID=2787631 RepID=UPI002ED80198